MNASIIVDIRNMRCGTCKVLVRDIAATECNSCGSVFNRIVSNHIGLAKKVEATRNGIELMNKFNNMDTLSKGN